MKDKIRVLVVDDVTETRDNTRRLLFYPLPRISKS